MTITDEQWTRSGPNVYDEHGEWIADCRVPNIYSQTCVEANAQEIVDDHNEVRRLRALLSVAADNWRIAQAATPMTETQRADWARIVKSLKETGDAR